MPTSDDHLRALLGEGDGGGATDARESPGDQDNWVAHILILAIYHFPSAEHGWRDNTP
jgi:hypothetical protein